MDNAVIVDQSSIKQPSETGFLIRAQGETGKHEIKNAKNLSIMARSSRTNIIDEEYSLEDHSFKVNDKPIVNYDGILAQKI
ncbi:hypothetical protein TIFTF001_010203 [Ficus carica]|uniref:Uncharacterized protein n=1 Tax=Ficus carica TaxID=3494 RepID=A0AA87ZW26_FICCA|nr:hypothetical protein TIFTF001_010203 [Ficus carica]